MLDRLRDKLDVHQDFVLLLILYTSFRLMALLLFRPGGFIADYSDYNTSYLPFAQWSNQGLYPFVDYWLEYPPLFPWLVVLVYRLSILITPWTEPRLWFNTLLGLSLLPFEVGSFVIIYLIALELYDQAGALRCAWIYAGLFAPLYTWLGWFDGIPLFFLLLALYLLLKRRGLLAGLALGLGFMFKVIPLLILPIGLRLLQGLRERARYLITIGLTAGLIALPFLVTSPSLLLTAFRSMLGRSSWETIWALLDGYYSYGVVGGNRFLTAVKFSTHRSRLPWLWITLFFALVYLWLYTRAVDWRNKVKPVAFAALSVNLFLFYSKGYSPQYIVTLLPWSVLLLPNLRGVLYTILLTAINFLEGTAYFIIFPEERWLLVGTVFSRSALILALTLEYGAIFFSLSSPRVKRIRDQAFWVLVVILLLVGCAAVYPLSKAYVENRYTQEEYRPVIELLRGEAEEGTTCLVLTDQFLYLRLYPWLRKDMDLYLVENEKQIAEAATLYNELWLFRGGEVPSAVKEWLEEHAHLVRDHDFDQGQLLHYAVR
jgi:hypothetical protein